MSSNNTTRLPPSMIASTYRRWIGTLHHSSSMRQISPISSTARISHPASRVPTGHPLASSSTSTRCGTLIALRRSVFIIRNPQSAIRNPQLLLRFKVDQRVATLGEAGPGLHLDDVIQHRPSDPERDLPRGALERTSSPGDRKSTRLNSSHVSISYAV